MRLQDDVVAQNRKTGPRADVLVAADLTPQSGARHYR